MASIEEKVEEHYKTLLDNIGLRHFGKTEKVNDSIEDALKDANSKSGGSGNNYPDIKCLLDNKHGRTVPVMIECKGTKGKLEKLSGDGSIVGVTQKKNGEPNYSAVTGFAVNGALHYGNAILYGSNYDEVIVVGVNGTTVNAEGCVSDPEYKAYYVSEKNHRIPKLIEKLDADWSLLKPSMVKELFSMLDEMNLTDEEKEKLVRATEATLEDRIHKIHQNIYDNEILRRSLSTNEKLYLFSGLIMAGLTVKDVAPLSHRDFKGNNSEGKNDGTLIIDQIREFLEYKQCSADKVEMILGLLSPVFRNKSLWRPKNGESILKVLFLQVQKEIVPILESNLHLDFTGKILNKLSDWVSIDNDAANDVVLTPRYVTAFMARLARTDMNSFVWDRAMGSAGFLVSAMDIMIKDAQSKIVDKDKLADKIRRIKEEQLLGIEILGNIYILAVLNMILMGDGSSNIINGNSHEYKGNFPATVFLLNPPYSADGKGFIFVEEALKAMTEGYACVLIQENAGSGQGGDYTKRILKSNTLIASIHMPLDLFGGKSSVQAAIYLFKVARPHEADDVVTFIDMAEDGYTRQNRKKSNSNVNLRDTDHAAERYAEVEAIVLGKMPKTKYYTEANGKVIRDTITMSGDDWTFNQHKVIDTRPTEADFKRTVAEYLSWKVGQIIKGEASANG
ncbi:MAG: N-6 DNA methylase [Acidaminococcaceae bacterium]|nr:N-6 DNA methylase [Acidaminococcaceae bacterium]